MATYLRACRIRDQTYFAEFQWWDAPVSRLMKKSKVLHLMSRTVFVAVGRQSQLRPISSLPFFLVVMTFSRLVAANEHPKWRKFHSEGWGDMSDFRFSIPLLTKPLSHLLWVTTIQHARVACFEHRWIGIRLLEKRKYNIILGWLILLAANSWSYRFVLGILVGSRIMGGAPPPPQPNRMPRMTR